MLATTPIPYEEVPLKVRGEKMNKTYAINDTNNAPTAIMFSNLSFVPQFV